MELIDKLTNIADVIRLRTGTTNKMTLDDMDNTVGKMSDCSNDTVTPGTLASGVTAHDKNGSLITGTLSADCGYGPDDLVVGTTPLAAGSYYFLVNEAHRSVGNVYVGDENGVASLWAEREIHDWSFVERVDPSCTVEGCDVYSCECGETKRENVIAASGHSYKSVVTAPTCTAQGYTTHTCSVCGDSYKDTYKAATGHSYGTAYYSSEFSTGYGKKCNKCGYLNALTIPTLATLTVGSSVFMNISGTRAEFIVVHKGLPSTDYDSSCDGIWLLTKDCYTTTMRRWDRDNDDYEHSDIHSDLNGGFLNRLDSDVQSIIKQVKIPYKKWTESGILTGSSGLSTKIFLLSCTEVGCSYDLSYTEGAVLSYFENAADSKRVANYNNGTNIGVATWWLRSSLDVYVDKACCVNSNGTISHSDVDVTSYYARPAFILPSTTLIDGTLISKT